MKTKPPDSILIWFGELTHPPAPVKPGHAAADAGHALADAVFGAAWTGAGAGQCHHPWCLRTAGVGVDPGKLSAVGTVFPFLAGPPTT